MSTDPLLDICGQPLHLGDHVVFATPAWWRVHLRIGRFSGYGAKRRRIVIAWSLPGTTRVRYWLCRPDEVLRAVQVIDTDGRTGARVQEVALDGRAPTPRRRPF